MRKTDSGVNFIEKYNQIFEAVHKAKATADMRTLFSEVKQFVVNYKDIDRKATETIYGKFQEKIQEMVSENEAVFQSLQNRMDNVKARGYDPMEYEKGKNYGSATNTMLLQLMARLPKTKTYATATIIDENLHSVAGCRAVLELMKYPAYADMVDEKQRQRACEGSKTDAQRAFENAREAELREIGKDQSAVYNDGFRLRMIAKQADAFMQPTVFGVDE